MATYQSSKMNTRAKPKDGWVLGIPKMGQCKQDKQRKGKFQRTTAQVQLRRQNNREAGKLQRARMKLDIQ